MPPLQVCPTRNWLTPTTQKLSTVKVVVDKFHMQGHIDELCLANCNPHSFKTLDKVCAVNCSTLQNYCVSHLQVDTEACEQCFSWLSHYGRITRRMQRSTFFFLLYMCDIHNEREEGKLRTCDLLTSCDQY